MEEAMINEFNLHKAELMKNVSRFRKTKKRHMLLQFYGDNPVKQFRYCYLSKRGFIRDPYKKWPIQVIGELL
jgi:hypothetical protein